MKIKGFVIALIAAVGMGSLAFADTYVSSSDAMGFVVTSDADMKIKAVIADYGDEGRLAGVATRIVDAVTGDNTYIYSELGASEINGERRIFLWKGEENSIEPINGKTAAVPEMTEAPETTEIPEMTEAPETTEIPEMTEAPETTEIPETTEAPETTEIPETTEAPETTEIPETTEAPGATEQPDDTVPEEYAKAMQSAVDNGLIDEGVLDATENITREQAAQIITRAMGDFKPEVDDFYAENSFTCADAYKLLAMVFDFDSYYIKYPSGKKEYIGKADEACLDVFADKATVSSELVEYAAAVVGNGGFTGFGGQLRGDSVITVGEFLYLMDSLIGTYIDEPGTYTGADFDTSRSVVVRKGGVTIDGLTTDKNLIIAYSVDTSGVAVTNADVSGVTSVMGGVDPEGKVSYVSINGAFAYLRINSAGITVNASGAKVGYNKNVTGAKINWGGF